MQWLSFKYFSPCLAGVLLFLCWCGCGAWGIRILSRENYMHLCTCSHQISPSDVRFHLADLFSNAWHETFELDCCRKKMKSLHWGADLWQRHPATGACAPGSLRMFTERSGLAGSLPVCWISSRRWTLRGLLCLSLYPEQPCGLKGHWISLQHFRSMSILDPFFTALYHGRYYLAPQEGCDQWHCVYTLMKVLWIESSWLQRLYCILQRFLMCFKTWYFLTPR